MPSSSKSDIKCTGGQTRWFSGFACTKYKILNIEKYDYECIVSINLKKGLIDDHNLLCPKEEK
jgi:hypothetical protein